MEAKIKDVNIEIGDNVSKIMYEASKLTHDNRPGLVQDVGGTFSGFKAMDGAYFGDISDLHFSIGLDGVGTKVEVAERIEDHSTVAYDLFAMICDDAVVRGSEPLAVGSIFDVRQLEDSDYQQKALTQLASGYVGAAQEAGVVVVNGEVAELGNRIGGYPPDAVMHFRGRQDTALNYNWGGVVMWFAHKERVITGHKVQPGDSLIGLAEPGFRSNGITDVRKIMEEHHGEWWHMQTKQLLGSLTLGEQVATPSTIYTKFINQLTGGHDISKEPRAEVSAVANITGGGQPSKIGRMLEPSGYGAVIDDPIEPPEIMKYSQEIGGYSDEDAYRVWHMGPGMVIATPEPDRVLEAAAENNQEAQYIGEVAESPEIIIKSAGVEKPGSYLTFS